jgi:hypothetical protein
MTATPNHTLHQDFGIASRLQSTRTAAAVSARCMKHFLAIITMVFLVTSLRGQVFTGEDRNDQFTVHGRLSVYNGSANLRIWIVGSKRMLYICGDNTPALDQINKFFGDGGGWFSRDVYADFTVEPLVPDTKGHMRPVRVLAVKHVVVTKDGKVVSKREDL